VKRAFWIVGVLTVATLMLAMAIAYIHGVEEGINSQLYHIKILEEQAHPGLIIDYFSYFHPLRNALFATGSVLTLCWIIVAAMVLAERKPKT
jgi:hypothetical protein